MPNLSVLGAQWGDEGKGKVVDFYARHADLVVRYAGGSNAGHTLVVNGRKLAVHLLPSGVARPGTLCVLGDAMVIDPTALLTEIDDLGRVGHPIDEASLRVSGRAHLVLPYHQELDALREGGPTAIGTTRRGIGPAYEDKMARRGVRVIDLLKPARLRQRLEPALSEAAARIEQLGGAPPDLETVLARLVEQGERLRPYVADTGVLIAEAIDAGRTVLFEGAQGGLLDIDHGTYPFVTSSTTVAGGIGAGTGVGPHLLGALVGVAKAYVTRVGEGPLPTEITGEDQERVRKLGDEFGSTTGRPRRCGWLDLPALRYVVRVSGLQWLALTKLDILAGLERIPVCEAYRLRGRVIEHLPADPDDLAAVEPVYREMEGFPPLRGDERAVEELPAGARAYVQMVERALGIGVCLVSIGPAREDTIVCHALP